MAHSGFASGGVVCDGRAVVSSESEKCEISVTPSAPLASKVVSKDVPDVSVSKNVTTVSYADSETERRTTCWVCCRRRE